MKLDEISIRCNMNGKSWKKLLRELLNDVFNVYVYNALDNFKYLFERMVFNTIDSVYSDASTSA
jgi:hypothetical protein